MARLQGVWSVEHPGACREHPEQDGWLLGGETRLNDQSAGLNLSAGVRLSLRGGHRSPMHVRPDKQWTAVEPDVSGSLSLSHAIREAADVQALRCLSSLIYRILNYRIS